MAHDLVFVGNSLNDLFTAFHIYPNKLINFIFGKIADI